MSTSTFTDAKRIQTSLLSGVEKRILYWFAARMPERINADHLTILGFVALLIAGVGYYLCQWNPLYLHIVNVALVIDWFGDSMDGTLARCRDMKRPRYGFYVDHICDAFGTVFILTGLALSGYLSPWVAWAILTVYLVMSINVYLATYTIGTFTLSFGRLSPTEGRVLLALFNLVLLYNPVLLVYGMSFPVSDVIGLLVILVLLAMLIHSVLMNTLTLYRAEPLRGNQ